MWKTNYNNNNNNNNDYDEQRADTAESPPCLRQRQDQERKLSVSNITVIKAKHQPTQSRLSRVGS